jgi:hypothetical protein
MYDECKKLTTSEGNILVGAILGCKDVNERKMKIIRYVTQVGVM